MLDVARMSKKVHDDSCLRAIRGHRDTPIFGMPSSLSEAADAAVLRGEPSSPEPVAVDIRQRNWLKRLLPQSMFGPLAAADRGPAGAGSGYRDMGVLRSPLDAVSYRLSSNVAGDVAMIIDAISSAATPAELNRLFERAAVADRTHIRVPRRCAAARHAVERIDARNASAARDAQAGQSPLCDRYEQRRAAYRDRGPAVGRDPAGERAAEPPLHPNHLHLHPVDDGLVAGAAVRRRRVSAQPGEIAAPPCRRGGRVRQGAAVAFTKVEGALEVRQAAAAFMQMRDRIQRQIGQRTEMLAGVSHDLRTPLTRMKLALALNEDDPLAGELKSDVADMERLVNLYLDFARGEGTETPVETDIGLLLEDLAAAARRDGTALTVVQAPELVLPIRPNALRRAV